MSSKVLLAALMAAGLLCAPVAASAQTGGEPPGAPRTPGWVFTPSLGMGGSWDDNVLLVHPANKPPPDYASPISPSLKVDYTGRRTHFSTDYDSSWVFYRNVTDLNSFDQSLRMTARHRATPHLTIFGEEHLTVSPSTDAVLLVGVPYYRIGTRTNAAGGGFEAMLTARTSFTGGYTLRSVAFDEEDPIGQLLQGGRAHEVSFGLIHAVSARLRVGAEYAFDRAIVGGQLLTSPGPGPDEDVAPGGPVVAGRGEEDRFNIQRGSVTAEYRLSRTLEVSAGLGVAQLGAGLTHPGQTGPTWGLGITRRGRHATVSGRYQRSYVPSFGFGGTFQNEEFTGSLLTPFARGRAYLESSLTWFDNDPIGAGQPSLRTLSGSAVVGYRATRWLNAEGYYVRTQQDSQLAGGQLARNQVGFRMVAARPVRLR